MRCNFKIDKYDWNVIIYYTVNDVETKEIIDMLRSSDIKEETFKAIKTNLTSRALDTGFTYSNYTNHYTIIVVHKASSIGEFINTVEHEKNHLEMHICEAKDINPYSEEAAHLSGNVSQVMIEELLYTIIEL